MTNGLIATINEQLSNNISRREEDSKNRSTYHLREVEK